MPHTAQTIQEEAVAAGIDTATDTEQGVTLVEEDLLVEDVSIDGMCGVY